MDLRFLSLGKFDVSTLGHYDKEYCNSDCYFDWIQLKKIDEKNDLYLLKNIFNYTVAGDMRNALITKDSFELGCHLQEIMMLVSDEDAEDFLEDVSCVYISMINLPMWKESGIFDSDSYCNLRTKTMDLIRKELDSSVCRLYYTFDHCDCVLIADGTKIQFSEYLTLLKKIRNVSVKNKELSLLSVLDITTIYGYSQDCFPNGSVSDDKLDLIIKLSMKQVAYKKVLLESLEKDTQLPQVNMSLDTIGRFDHIFVWKNISISDFNKIIKIIRSNNEYYFAYCIHMGFENADLCESYIYKSDDLLSDLSDKSELLFKSMYKDINKDAFNEQLLNAIVEVHRSIYAMLNRGFSQYYILAFYESFYSFVGFLVKESKKYIKECSDREQIDINKKVVEKIYDMYRTYFAFLNALTSSTIHSERQFLQTDSYQMLYFDAPPKLIAFYTAMANKIASFMEKNTNNIYTFLITPDFKEDIFVDSLTEDMTIGNEHNILIIHINEESMYDVVSTIKSITHEIYHHVGQDEELRRKRATPYIKSCLAYIISKCMDFDVLKEQANGDIYGHFKWIVNQMYDELFCVNGENIFPVDWEVQERKGEALVHYSKVLTVSFIEYISLLFSSKNVIERIKNLFVHASKEDELLFDIDKYDEIDKEIVDEFSINRMSEDFYNKVHKWLLNNHYLEDYSIIQHTFRESFADTCMLGLLFDDNKEKCDGYANMMYVAGGNKHNEEKTRIVSVLRNLWEDHFGEHPWICTFETVNKSESDVKISSANWNDGPKILDGYFYYYLSEAVVDYLSCIKFPKDEESVRVKNDIMNTFKLFEGNSVKDIVQAIDKEIFEYRLKLLES